MAEPTRDPNLGGYDSGAQAQVTGANSGAARSGVGAPGSLFAKPGDNQPSPQQQALNSVSLDPDQIKEWFERIEAAQERRKLHEEKWDTLLDEYEPAISKSGSSEDPKVSLHFRNVHTKIGQVFVRSPEIRLTPQGPAIQPIPSIDPATGQPTMIDAQKAVFIKQAGLNKWMGPDKIDGLTLMDECLFDGMAWSGVWAVKVGYRATMGQVTKPVMVPDPSYQPPPPSGVLGLSPTPPPPMVPATDPATGQPQTTAEPVVIDEDWYADRFSAKKLLLDELLKSTRYSKQSRWVGMEFFMSKRQAKREFGLSDKDIDSLTSGAEDDRVHKFQSDGPAPKTQKNLIHGYECWYYGVHFLDDEVNPRVVYQLALIDGIKDRTVVSRRSPDQDLDDTGRLTPDSVHGLPIKVGCLRVLADSPYPSADSAFVNTQVKGINTHRRQAFKIRDAQIGKYAYDTGALDKDDLDKVRNGEVGEFIGLKEGILAQGIDRVLVPLKTVASTADDWRLANQLRSDMDDTLGISAQRTGSPLHTVESATEVAQSAADAAGRQQKEQARAVAFYLEVVRAVDQLLVRYATEADYVSWEGEDGAQQIAQFNNKIAAGEYAYEIRMDSQLSIDVARDRQQKLAFYNLAAPDPLFNRAVVLRDIARDFGYDTSKVVLSPQAQMTQPPHGGGPVNKHLLDNSGGRPNAPNADTRHDRNPGTGAATPTPVQPPGNIPTAAAARPGGGAPAAPQQANPANPVH